MFQRGKRIVKKMCNRCNVRKCLVLIERLR